MSQKYKWWHGLAFYAGVQVARLAMRAVAVAAVRRRHGMSLEQDRNFYKKERLPWFAPPPLAFPIAWSINSASSLAGGLHVLNLPPDTPGRAHFLRRQALAWTLFAAFDAAYFGLRSPINAEVVTILYSAATVASIQSARRMQDSAAALSLLSTAAWLALANLVGAAQAAWNPDPFWKVGPLLEPDPAWLKQPAPELQPYLAQQI